MHFGFTFLVVLVALLAMAQTTAVASDTKSEVEDTVSLWDALARQHIRPGRIGDVELPLVDYKAIGADSRWKALLKHLETAREPASREEKLAFWINAYNIMAIKVVLDKYPVRSIRNAGGWITQVWDIDAGVVAGRMRTLNEIEHEILRSMDEPRIHAAIVCASVSCPPIRAEAFTAERLEEQLEDQMRVWLANPEIGLRVERGGATLRVSSIFKWFGEDFEKEAGSVRVYLDRYLTEAQKAELQPNARIAYLSYDWTLNDTARNIQAR